ncbi:protein sisterless A [Bactrocera oleae]|uniref:protein sisterless A n=1 Tax=Bactrocera oleae TaxID=104688 RepID=UPI00387E95E6
MSETQTDKTVRSLAMRSSLANCPLVFETSDKLRTLSLYEKEVRKKAFDNFIAAEMRRQQSKLKEEQQIFITQKLEDNPVEIGSRTHSPSSSLDEMTTKFTHAETVDHATALLREQRAASCRKSRINNKLRKASLKHRNDFLAEKVSATKRTLAVLSSKLQTAQQYLLGSGFNESQIENLRSIYGVSCMNVN